MAISVTLLVAAASALVGLLCLALALVAAARIGRARKGEDVGGDTPAGLKRFALRQGLSAAMMFALAAIIMVYS